MKREEPLEREETLGRLATVAMFEVKEAVTSPYEGCWRIRILKEKETEGGSSVYRDMRSIPSTAQ